MPSPSISPRPRAVAFALLAVLAPALGGSTELWARGVLLAATAAVLLVWPPRRGPGRFWTVLAVALLAVAGAAFLPANWLPAPHWRRLLTDTFQVPLPQTWSAQPWLSLESAGLLLGAVVYSAALWAHDWTREERGLAVRIHAVGILILAGLAIGSQLAHWHVPWWPEATNSGIGFGFFPNRNQTANVLALAGIMLTALGFEILSRGRRAGYACFAGTALIGVALVFAYSRAGIALFFGGTAAWVGWSLRFSASRKGTTLGFAAVLALLTAFLLFGGDTLKRFEHQPDAPSADYRILVQRDAWRLAAEQPWIGHGLGNFEPLFAVTRVDSKNQKRALHPESDWLWAGVELGWPVVLLLAAGLVAWFAETLPLAAGTDRHLRSAAAVCGIAFALHGLVDVSGHRAGAVWPALLLFALARNSQRLASTSRCAAPIFRLGGVAVAFFGLWWMASAARPEKYFPTTQTLAWLEARLDRQNRAADYPAMLTTADAALRIAPLDWHLYYQRAVAHAALPDGAQAAAADFDRARFLEPSWVDLCLGEAKVWLALDEPEQALNAWVEALHRAGPEAPQFFPQMLAGGWKNLTLRTALARVAQTNPDLLVIFLENATGLDFDAEATRLLARDPELRGWPEERRRRLFSAWFRNGDRDRLLALLAAHPPWQGDAWLGLANYAASRGDFERAWRFVESYGPVPALPHLVSGQSLAELERGFYYHPDDLQQGLAFFQALRQARQLDEALATLRALDRLAARPDYVPYLEAILWAEKGEWAKAWEAWTRYFAQVPRA